MFGPAFLGRAKLAQNAGIGERWWSHHIQNTRAYLEASLSHDVPASIAALGQLWADVLDWQKITRSKTEGVLMAEHTALAKVLIDCHTQNLGSNCEDEATAALLRNVEEQRILFPVNSNVFAELLKTHVVLTGQYIAALANGRRDEFGVKFNDALENGRELGLFTDKAF
jgi:hypothetical protein